MGVEESNEPSAKKARARGRANAGSPAQSSIELGTDKLYFKIGEVAEIVGVAAHVLRFWETEFRGVRPQKSRTRQRVYRRRDVELLLRIKHLLYEQRFTIAGARQQLTSGEPTPPAEPSPRYRLRNSAARVRERLNALASLLRSDEERDPICADPAWFVREGGGIRTLLGDDVSPEGAGTAALETDEDLSPSSDTNESS